jgi:hypothetical protein
MTQLRHALMDELDLEIIDIPMESHDIVLVYEPEPKKHLRAYTMSTIVGVLCPIASIALLGSVLMFLVNGK